MVDLVRRLLESIRKQDLLRAGDRVAVAVSGGADSVALLLLLLELRTELGVVLSAAHVNHKLRGAESDEDQYFVEHLAARFAIDLEVVAAPLDGTRAKSGVEAAARKLRQQFFLDLARRGISKVATAHTLDDQAETVLLRIFRGTGIRGLAGVHPRMDLASAGKKAGELVRPLLGFRRSALREYLSAKGQSWREDSSNSDSAFLRNRVRQRLLPLIAQEFGDAAIEHMGELAEIARAEERWAAASGAALLDTDSSALNAEQLLQQPIAVQRRAVRAWIERNNPDTGISFRLIEEILDLAHGSAGKKFELPGAGAGPGGIPTIVRRGRTELTLESEGVVAGYEYALPVPGNVEVPQLQTTIEACVVNVEDVLEADRDALLDPHRVGAKLLIRNWRPGDRFWPSHTAAEKKVKELLSDRHATGADKKRWPVAVSESGELVWMLGFAVPAALQVQTGKAVWIRAK